MFASHRDKKGFYFLEVLWSGLERLFSEVRQCEQEELVKLHAAAGSHGRSYLGSVYSSFGNGPNDALILNDFVWYASSAACFLQLFDHSFGLTGSYRDAFPAMLKWRDKVAAHTAYVVPIAKHKEPDKIDSPASQDFSITMHPEWDNDHYAVGGWIFGGMEGSSHGDWQWALTRTHPEIQAFVKRHL